MTSFTSLRQVHMTDYFSDPSITPQTIPKSPDECRSFRLRPHCWNAVAPVPPVQPELSASLSRVSCDMTETVQNQPNKTFFSGLGDASASSRPPCASILVNFFGARSKTPIICRFRESRQNRNRGLSDSQFDVKVEKKTATKVTKIQPSGEQTPAEYLQQFFPTLTCLHANERITCSHLTNQQQLPLCCFFFLKILFCIVFKGCFFCVCVISNIWMKSKSPKFMSGLCARIINR